MRFKEGDIAKVKLTKQMKAQLRGYNDIDIDGEIAKITYTSEVGYHLYFIDEGKHFFHQFWFSDNNLIKPTKEEVEKFKQLVVENEI